MIVLRPYETKLIMPVPERQWREPSLSVPRDQVGNSIDQTRFRARARLHDGHVVWAGWFDSRDDWDAFLWSLANGRLAQEPELWKLPTPQWHPDLGEHLSYDFATVTFVTGSPGSNQTYTSPIDWDNNANTVEALGAGASGAAIASSASPSFSRVGNGGGGYSRISNHTFATPGTSSTTYRVGAGGDAQTSTVDSNGNGAQLNGAAGGDSWFGGASLGASNVGAQGGQVGNGASTGGSGGSDSNGIGTTKYSGGKGGNSTGFNNSQGTGGGGAASPTGAGNAGTNASSYGQQTAGGGGGSGGGGAGGTAGGGTGGNGTNWDATHGAGGGGGGRNAGSSGAGGNYGGGSGGSRNSSGSVTSPAGKQGMIVITYTPRLAALGFNLAMMGM